jgi:citrate/tricarballylate utilization protein
MAPLEQLVREAAAAAEGPVSTAPAVALSAAEAEVARVLQICNACRYCEGFCAVFPAMTRRLEFPRADVHYLANLCHNCGACLHACQYAPPHEFAVAVPPAMARVRARTYAEHAWPPAMGVLYARSGLFVSISLAVALASFLVLALALTGALWHEPLAGSFYRAFPHGLMAAIFVPVFGFALLALVMGVRRFWRDQAPGPSSPAALAEATRDILQLKYLDGGHGEGCNEADDAFTLARRRLHHLTFYGFALCFAATCVGTVYHYAFGWIAPYAFTSLPKLLGVSGGVLLAVGSAGLWRLRLRRHPQHVEPTQAAMDIGFIALLFGTATTGLLLAAWRNSGALALLLAVHLGFVMALFATMPYGKFAHGVYRAAALLKWAIEKRRPPAPTAGAE